MGELWLVRHGETEWTVGGRHTSRTDVPLTDGGRQAARALQPQLSARMFALVLVSPRERALETAALAGFPDAEVEPNLAEWDYGDLEGRTTDDIRAQGSEWASWTIWTGLVPGGDTIERVAARASALLAWAAAAPGDAIFFGHGHMLRVLTACALGCDPHDGARFALDPASVNVIGDEREQRVLRAGNAFSQP